MSFTIRKITIDDFEEASSIFEFDNSVEELKWLFQNPDDENDYNAMVAIDNNNEIIGVLGYFLSDYRNKDQKISVVIPMNWIVKTGYKGFAGISLFKKVTNIRDTSIAIWGTDVVKKLYPMFKFKHVIDSDIFYKIIKPRRYFKILKRKNILKKIGVFLFLIPSYFNKPLKRNLYSDVKLVPYTFDNFIQEKASFNTIKKVINKNYVDWMLKCPSVDSFAFVVQREEEIFGICVLYIKRIKNTYIGRIVHLPELGVDVKLWYSVINECVNFLKSKGCCFISAVGIDEVEEEGITKSGFTKFHVHREPIYVKNENDTFNSMSFSKWSFQYSDGEIMLRNF
tara:strand:- start:544424 stop:545440 length:1017 start_codon:yes stop_codon:yes gene_type:complete